MLARIFSGARKDRFCELTGSLGVVGPANMGYNRVEMGCRPLWPS
jgi:hypothetical protein